MYRHPFTFLLMVFLPIILLGLFTLTVFFQPPELAGRIASLATLLVAYTAFFPTVREQIPPFPIITYFEMGLYGVMGTSLLCLLRSFLDSFEEPYKYDWKNDPIYLICIVTDAVFSLAVVVGMIIFKVFEHFKYNDDIE